MRDYTIQLHALLAQHENRDDAMQMKKYMRDQYVFFGIKSPKRKEIVKVFVKKEGYPPEDIYHDVIKELWDLPERECQMVALDLLERSMKRWKERDIQLLEDLIVSKSWWDSVDWIATRLVGNFFQMYPHLILPFTNKWMNSENIWLQRSAILFQLKYKADTDERLLYQYILKCAESKEFFIQKGIGWALREYSKTNPSSVVAFVSAHEDKLSSLSKREGLRIVKKKK
ncbi:DNA alkylation repair protein [Bacillus alkalicellulosilyticus]|uniref:DNA alkylation repair protein n=1 Tax=Alkalihalobacterium alkalicellulosilyticum TaxID=1912214 RepID=UPI001FEBBC5A|nr:DNA alkylation repair protein [Bacillus alkalicellulosilyticus]